MVELFNDNCFNIFNKLSNIDLVICDMPYGKTHNKWDSMLNLDVVWENIHKVTKENAAVILFAQGIFYVDLVNSNKKEFRYDIVWDKVLPSGHLNARRMPLRTHEQLAVFYKKLPTYNPQMTVGKPLHSIGSKNTTQIRNGSSNNNYGEFIQNNDRAGSTDKFPISIQRFPKPHPSLCIHPTAKPVELLQWLVLTFSNEGETVLDFCMGSGSTGVACVNTNRNFIGIEKDVDYFNIAKERIEHG